MILLYKNNGIMELCDHYHGIALFSSKILMEILLSQLNVHIVDTIIPESKCAFSTIRGTMDMIFTAWQIQENSLEPQGLFQAIVDLKQGTLCGRSWET